MVESVKSASFHERCHTDSFGRKWDFTQKRRIGRNSYSYIHPWNQGTLVWVCADCGWEEPVKYKSVVHDEVIVPDPSDQLDSHSCDLARVYQVMES